MLNKTIHLVCFLLVIANVQLAHGNVLLDVTKVVGTIMDRDTRIPLEFVTVALYNQKDSSFIEVDISNIKG